MRGPESTDARADAPSRSRSPLRILLTSWQDFGAGSIQSVQYLASGLAKRGHAVVVATPADGTLGQRLADRGIPVEDFRFDWGWNPRDGRELARLVRHHGFDLVDAQESKDRKAAILARWVFGEDFPLIITRRQPSSTFFLENWLYSIAADRTVAISAAVAESLASSGVRRDKIDVVHTGLDRQRIQGPVDNDTLTRLRSALDLDPALPTVGVVSRRKDQETLLRAAGFVGQPLNLLMVGIDRDESLAREERHLPGTFRVAYTGFVDDVRPYLDLLDVKVLTTLREGLSQALLEAMGRGVPVITASAGGTIELVEEGVNGLCYAPGDATALADRIRKLLSDPELEEKLRAEGRRTITGHFSAERFVLRTEAVYRRVLASHDT